MTTIYKIKKRNGEIVDFDRSKISEAVKKAIKSTGWEDFSELDQITEEAIEKTAEKVWWEIPTVEDIQDSVEEALIKHEHDQVAKSYILYRQKRTESRESRNVVVQVQKTMQEYLEQSDWRVNANANSGYSLGWLILNTAGKVTANYWLSNVYPQYIGDAHRSWDIHIHDLDMFSGYCAGWSLRQLLEEWFNWLADRVNSKPPKNLQSAVNQMINFLGTLQNEWAGAQAFSSFDTYLAPFVHKYKKQIYNELEEVGAQFESEEAKEEFVNKKTYKYVYQQLQNFIFGLNVPSRWWTQTPFTNITLDLECPEDLKDKALYLGGYDKWPYEKTYGELKEEMRIINKAIIDVYTQWDANWNVFTFPIPTYNVTEDFPWDDPLVDDLFEMTAKYGIPYFQNFVGSQYKFIKDANWKLQKVPNEDAFTPGAVRSMCCRLQLDLTQLEMRWNGLFGSAEMTGSIGVVTLNMARIGYKHKNDIEGFKENIYNLMEIAKTSLEIKRKELTNWLERGLYPYTKRYLNSFNNHFATIGVNGMNEAILNFTDGEHDITTEWWHNFALEILSYMRDVLKDFQEETGNLYNLEATPGEGATYRFAKEDQKQHPGIIQAWTESAPYYTNSSQLPVLYTDDAFEAVEMQNDLQCKYNGWTVLHLYMWERISDSTACKNLMKKIIENYQLPYVTITPTFSICPKHGYIPGEHDYCPKCDEELGYVWEKYDLETRKVYTENKEKLKEIKETTNQ